MTMNCTICIIHSEHEARQAWVTRELIYNWQITPYLIIHTPDLGLFWRLLAKKKRSVVGIDLHNDQLLSHICLERVRPRKAYIDVLQGKALVEDAIYTIAHVDLDGCVDDSRNYWLVPLLGSQNTESRFAIAQWLRNNPELGQQALATLERRFDLCVIDAPELKDPMSEMALQFASHIVVPLPATPVSAQKVRELVTHIRKSSSAHIFFFLTTTSRYRGDMMLLRKEIEVVCHQEQSGVTFISTEVSGSELTSAPGSWGRYAPESEREQFCVEMSSIAEDIIGRIAIHCGSVVLRLPGGLTVKKWS